MMNESKILIVQLGRIGDLILTTPMLRALKQKSPHCKIHVLAGRHNHNLAEEHPLVDKVHAHTKRPFQTLRLLLELKRERFDYWIDPKDHYSSEGHFFAGWARAKHRIGYNEPGRAPRFDRALAGAGQQMPLHAVRRNLAALRCFNLQDSDPRPILFVRPVYEERLQGFLRSAQIESYVCAHLSAGNDIRYWPQRNWIELLSSLSSARQSVLITFDRKDTGLAKEIVAEIPSAQCYATDSIVEMFSVVRRAALVIAPDTSVVHIASAFDRPLLGLYSNHRWNCDKFAPLSTHHRMVVPPEEGALVRNIDVGLARKALSELLADLQSVMPRE